METLAIIRNLLDFMNENILYCHWKSTEHIGKTLTGDTDIDILIDRQDKEVLLEGLNRIGFKRFEIPQLRDYVAVEDYLGLDLETGRIVHLHLHYQLTQGEKHLKGSRLPIESLMLNTRKFLQKEKIYVVNENLEAVFFMIRFAIKLRKRDFFKELIGKKYIDFGSLLEYKWLKNIVDENEMKRYGGLIFSEDLANEITKVFFGKMDVYSFSKLRNKLKPHLRIISMYSPLRTLIERYRRELFRVIETSNRKTIQYPFYFRRRPYSGGLTVAFVGVDGAGKSSIVKKIHKDFSKEMNVYFEYLGSGLGKSSFIRYPLKVIYRSLIKLKIWDTKKGSDSVVKGNVVKRTNNEKVIKKLGDLPWALTLSMERLKKLKRVMAYRNRGFLVLTDRYPQNKLEYFHDGRRLADNNNSRFYQIVSNYEKKVYDYYGKYTPDLVIRILVDPEVAYTRKSNEITLDGSREAQNLLRNVTYEGSEIIELYNNGSFDDILNQVKQVIWERL
jgi:thymidylate kinase